MLKSIKFSIGLLTILCEIFHSSVKVKFQTTCFYRKLIRRSRSYNSIRPKIEQLTSAIPTRSMFHCQCFDYNGSLERKEQKERKYAEVLASDIPLLMLIGQKQTEYFTLKLME